LIKEIYEPPTNGISESDVASEENGYVNIGVTLSIYTGMKKTHGQVITDAKYRMEIFKDLDRINFDGFDSLHLKRNGRPKKIDLAEHPRLPTGELLYSTNLVQVTYIAKIPMGVIPEIYEKHKDNADIQDGRFYSL